VPSIASSSGVRQNQQNSLRHRGAGPAIGNGSTCNKDEKMASAQRRKGMDRIGSESSIPKNQARQLPFQDALKRIANFEQR